MRAVHTKMDAVFASHRDSVSLIEKKLDDHKFKANMRDYLEGQGNSGGNVYAILQNRRSVESYMERITKDIHSEFARSGVFFSIKRIFLIDSRDWDFASGKDFLQFLTALPYSANFEDPMEVFPPRLNIVQVRIRSGTLIDWIQFVAVDGSTQSWGSERGGSEAPPFDLAPDEHIVRVAAQQGDSLDGLRIYTTRGRESQWYGGRGGRPQEFAAPPGDPIVALERVPHGFCSRIARAVRLSEAR